MKKIFCLLTLFIATTFTAFADVKYDITLPLKGETEADLLLQRNILGNLLPFVQVTNKGCEYFSIPNTKLVHSVKNGKVRDGKYVEGYWREIWSVNACGKVINYPILFTLDGNGGTYFKIEAKKGIHY